VSRLTSDLPLAERVRNGADLLDLLARAGRVPNDWRTKVDLSVLNMRSGRNCVLGHVARSIDPEGGEFYDFGEQIMGMKLAEDEAFGFYMRFDWTPDGYSDWSGLAEAWKAYLAPTDPTEPAEVPTP
jgi:hypothetical protein